VDLAITGMTCASRAARVEKELNKLDGVTATVNFATESARVAFPAAVTVGDLISVVEQAGYGAAEPAAPEGEPAGAARPDAADDEATPLRQRLLVCLALAIPVVLLAMVPALQFRNWQWLALALASPVAVWGRGHSTAPRWSTPGTGPRPWTRWCRWA
jgi:Cu+-exporting ATPase